MLNNLPPALKNLLIINVLVYFASYLLGGSTGIDVNDLFGLHYFQADLFKPYQLVTYMFLHANFQHLFFNMFGLFMFGRVLEQVWGSKRFLIFFFVTGIGAALVQETVQFFELRSVVTELSSYMQNIPQAGLNVGSHIIHTRDELLTFQTDFLNRFVTIGASGAVFGVLLAFGMLFPNTEMYLMFIPIPIKAKYMVIGYGALELITGISGMSGSGSNIAHFAHLGGMLFGFFLIRYWKKNTSRFY